MLSIEFVSKEYCGFYLFSPVSSLFHLISFR
jgi:hypothetical protein